jgi:hypothetical protein
MEIKISALFFFANFVLCLNGKKMSLLRDNIGVIILIFLNFLANKIEVFKVISFSRVPNCPIAPGSFPP